ncbi:cytochrome-c oxidase, cbb3-type subunit III [Halothiobacillus sp. DCM-1]|uniref:cytochrome-c oxidase, cbb3-type subunit III n=1 Tax=Halothiobacillus sp. DCM-1 TaxID=3112558 RepID=UPI00324D9E5C
MSQSPEIKKGQVETTGHVWDGDLREYNNPLPRWWLWAFYGTIVFAVVYWILYPAWPYAGTYTKGVETVSFTVKEPNGQEKTVTEHWNSRALFNKDMESSPSALAQKEWLAKVKDMSFEQIAANPDTLNFARSMGHALFGDHCAACHGTGGQGVLSMNPEASYPNLTDDAWIHGSSYEKIVQDITNGIHGNMPAFGALFQGEKRADLAQYVLSLSHQSGVNEEAANRGKALFATCAGCHGATGAGNQMIGAPNLTDQSWDFVDISGAKDYDEKLKLIEGVIANGLNHQMPKFGDRLSPEQIRLLAVYVRQLGGS